MAEGRTDEELVRAVLDGFAGDVLSEDYPLSEVEKELREAGLDPVETGQRVRELAQQLSKRRRLAWQTEAVGFRDAMQGRLAKRTPVGILPRAKLLERLEVAKRDPRLGGDIAIAARSLTAEASDDELRQVLEELEALARLAGPDDDGRGNSEG